jgi:dCTP deaminase
MFLTDVDIKRAMKKGEIAFEPDISDDQIGPGSVDLTLDNRWWFFRKGKKGKIDLTKTGWQEVMEEKKAKSIILKPQQMCLAITKEKITLADDIVGLLEGRSRYARMGLSIHITSSFVQPGVSNHQVLEVLNNSNYDYVLSEGMRIMHIVFARAQTPTSKPYRKFGDIARGQ